MLTTLKKTSIIDESRVDENFYIIGFHKNYFPRDFSSKIIKKLKGNLVKKLSQE